MSVFLINKEDSFYSRKLKLTKRFDVSSIYFSYVLD